MAEIIKLKNISKTYYNGIATQVLFDINLTFKKGSFNSLVGESGSGKSTLLNILGTLDRPTSGELYIDGERTAEMKKNELARLRNDTIGFIFQFHYLLPEFTALENVMIPNMIKGKKGSKRLKNRAIELMEMVGLADVQNNLATKMSGGQQQRTAIARALMNNPKIILADEPTGNLDSVTTGKIYELFRDINARLDTTFIIVTHERRIAEQTDRIVEIKDGKIYMDIAK